MAELFTAKYALIWMVALAAALYFPVRQMIWIISVRRAERDGDKNEERRGALKKRAGMTAALLAFVFAYLYTTAMFDGAP